MNSTHTRLPSLRPNDLIGPPASWPRLANPQTPGRHPTPPPVAPGAFGVPLTNPSIRAGLDPEVHAMQALAKAPRADVDGLMKLASAMMALPPDPRIMMLVQKATRGPLPDAERDELISRRGLAIAEVLRVFPGPMTSDVLAGEQGEVDLDRLVPLARLVKSLGVEARCLVAAHGHGSAQPPVRWASLLLAGETAALQMPVIVARRLVDPVPRIAWLAANLVRKFVRTEGPIGERAAGVVSHLVTALSSGSYNWRLAGVRLALVLRDERFVPGLISLTEVPDLQLSDGAVHVLEDLSGQHFGRRRARWERWWKQRQGTLVAA